MSIAVLLSGSGRTLENLLACGLPVTAVVSSRKDVRGNEVARAAGLPLTVASGGDYVDKTYEALDLARPALVCLAGYLRRLPLRPGYVGRVMNVHPSLLPAFGGRGYYGQHVHEAVLSRGCKVSGCTVHFVDDEYDHGPIILQRAVPVLEGDGASDLAARVFREECLAYPEAVRLFLEGRLEVVGGAVKVRR